MAKTHCPHCGASLADPFNTVMAVRDPALVKLDYEASRLKPPSSAARQNMNELRARIRAQGVNPAPAAPTVNESAP